MVSRRFSLSAVLSLLLTELTTPVISSRPAASEVGGLQHSLHAENHPKVGDEFESLSDSLQQVGELLSKARSAQESAEVAASNFAQKNPTDFYAFGHRVEAAAQDEVKALEQANKNVLKKDEETPREALRAAEKAAAGDGNDESNDE
eukprot:TRINITY_DN102464_c0_g1_i1.p1 TRINITY_DN102464_c0_g1~~TRINITY_DN102464_c0_g1_i1.p1  ORF type:complete len:147 (-),score=44.59 TRINITY_DN102464_c0_g1_i1:7-447(-)